MAEEIRGVRIQIIFYLKMYRKNTSSEGKRELRKGALR